jgi:hypothetical protein
MKIDLLYSTLIAKSFERSLKKKCESIGNDDTSEEVEKHQGINKRQHAHLLCNTEKKNSNHWSEIKTPVI